MKNKENHPDNIVKNKMIMENIQNLINQVAIISKKNTEILDATGGRFNMFRVCGVNHYENTHSAIIAEFLNPNGTHGLKIKLLECFIEELGESFTIQNFNCEKARVRSEHTIEEGQGRIDILIEDDLNKAIIIENKIYAKDQPEQLKRYSRYAETYKNGYQILYLTLWGDPASEQSGEEVYYLPISYKENIINWLDKCVAIASRFPMVRETIIQYINHLKQLTNQDMDTKSKEEITEFLSKIENLKAAKDIYDNYKGIFNILAKEHFNPKMKLFAAEKELKYIFEESGESYIRFCFEFSDSKWHKRCTINFQNDGKRYFYGLHDKGLKSDHLNALSDKDINAIREYLNSLGIKGNKPSPGWIFDQYIDALNFDTWINDIVNSSKFFDNCTEKIKVILSAIERIDF